MKVNENVGNENDEMKERDNEENENAVGNGDDEMKVNENTPRKENTPIKDDAPIALRVVRKNRKRNTERTKKAGSTPSIPIGKRVKFKKPEGQTGTGLVHQKQGTCHGFSLSPDELYV